VRGFLRVRGVWSGWHIGRGLVGGVDNWLEVLGSFLRSIFLVRLLQDSGLKEACRAIWESCDFYVGIFCSELN